VSAAARPYAVAVGYQPTLAEEMGVLQERITSTKHGSITFDPGVYVPADDLTDLARPPPRASGRHCGAVARHRGLGIYRP